MPMLSDQPVPLSDIQRQLEMTHSQLGLYARDLKRILAVEREQRRELADANARLKILDRLKTDFLSFISHELRTPLNLLSAVDLIDPQANHEEQHEMLETIRRGYQWLDAFVKRGLEYFTWLARDRIDTEVTVDLAAIVTAVSQDISESAGSAVQLDVWVPPYSCHVRADGEPVTAVVQILLDNAVKFSPSGTPVSVVVADANTSTTLTITDHGQGFPPELAGEIFQPFTIANAQHHARGTGLSLALADAILHAYGATIRADSRGVGQGAQFIVQFPPVPHSDGVAA